MYSRSDRQRALAILDETRSVAATSRLTGIARSTVRAWRDQGVDQLVDRSVPCARCGGATLPEREYGALFGFYLGDGCISTYRSSTFLRIACDAAWPGVIDDVTALVGAVRPDGGVHPGAPGVVVVQSTWKHWPCVFPSTDPAASTSGGSA